MKKLTLLIILLSLTSCFWPSNEEIQKAKNDIFNNSWSTTSNSGWENTLNKIKQNKIFEKSYFKINHLTWDNFIDIKKIDLEKIKDKFDLKWVVNNPDIEKIKVYFKNENSKFPTDEYILKTYKKWNKDFLYRAYKTYNVLDYWLNIYTIEWYVWDNLVSKVELEVYLEDKSKIIELKNENFTSSWLTSISFTWDIFEKLPKDDNIYWELKINDNNFTYSNLKNIIWFKNNEIYGVNCENFAEYLKQNYTWYYWNTCRPIKNWLNFTVNVLTLIWDQYKYEKHYISPNNWLYIKVLLDSWSDITQNDLQKKNDELKQKIFDDLKITDKLFDDLIN